MGLRPILWTIRTLRWSSKSSFLRTEPSTHPFSSGEVSSCSHFRAVSVGSPRREATTTIVNPANDCETSETRLWPDHCVAGTPGNELVPELDLAPIDHVDLAPIDHVVLKVREPRIEMYSVFRSPLRGPPLAGAVSDLAEKLVAVAVTDVFVVGLAGDYSANLGWRTYVIEEGTRSVERDAGVGVENCDEESPAFAPQALCVRGGRVR
ncbi:pyrazinamidase/nicotinamidase [Ganoderma leucocontextum]|nr:pyrazinamidase/nicotinamidase [Ganoderma leucocontextum]